MRIGVAFDLAPEHRVSDNEGTDDRFEEFDKPETIEALADVLRAEGHEVLLLGNGRDFLQKILLDPPDLVWNMAEGEGIGRCRESRVPAVLEMLGIPCTGSDPLTIAASLDKDVAKTLVREAGVIVPAGLTFLPDRERDSDELSALLTRFSSRRDPPWIVKPAFEGSSKGIRNRSVVESVAEATQLVLSLMADYQQPILLEEFVNGDEVTVGLIGEGPGVEVIGSMGIRPRGALERFVYSLEMKRDWQQKVVYDVPARLPADVLALVHSASILAYRTLGCRDVARIDFRVRDGIPYFLEANPLPGLAPDWSDLVIMARGLGLSHADLIRRILDRTFVRLGLQNSVSGASVP